MIYVYDAEGSPVGFRYLNSTYYSGIFDNYIYGKNVRGDIIYIFTRSGDKVAEYSYDAWGKPVTAQYYNSSNNPGVMCSPFRYRGYWYDEETGLYYLNSRYYNPEWGRFINADRIDYLGADGSLTGYNLFAYCGGNPANRTDSNGNHWYYLWLDDLIDSINELAASVSNIVYGKAAFERNFYDPKGASDLWNSRPFQETKPSPEMQIFTEFVYNHDFVADVSVSVSVPKTPFYGKVGVSRVISPNKNIDASYVHLGSDVSTPTLWPVNVTYSVGMVNGVESKEKYNGPFIDISGGCIYGFDYCWWPKGANAFCYTIGSSYGVYKGLDLYRCIN